jgi:ABC-2 type transport system ATP-binding protein
VIEARGLVRKFGAKEALRGIDLTIARGEMFGLIGPDGAGKTTFFRLVAGRLEPTAGTIRRDPSATFGFVPQRFALYEDLSIDENLELRAKLYDVPKDEALRRAADLLARVGLERFRDRLAGALSGGMKQKLALVAALLTRPPLLLLDEPTTGVDAATEDALLTLVRGLVRDGLPVLMTTHDLDRAPEWFDRLIVVDRKILADGTPDAVLESGAYAGIREHTHTHGHHR